MKIHKHARGAQKMYLYAVIPYPILTFHFSRSRSLAIGAQRIQILVAVTRACATHQTDATARNSSYLQNSSVAVFLSNAGIKMLYFLDFDEAGFGCSFSGSIRLYESSRCSSTCARPLKSIEQLVQRA